MLESLKIKIRAPICNCKFENGLHDYSWSVGYNREIGPYLSISCKKCKAHFEVFGQNLRASIEVANIPAELKTKSEPKKEEPKPKKKIELPSYMKVIKDE